LSGPVAGLSARLELNEGMTTMSDPLALRALTIFRTRLAVLAGLLAKAEEQGADLEGLLAARLAPDMHAFPWQLVFACNQARQFVAWCGGPAYAEIDANGFDWQAGKAHVEHSIATLDAAIAADLACPGPVKRIDIPPINAYLELTGERFVDDWLLPNFYFHIAMAYALLRSNGVAIGKADFMAFLAEDLRPMG
jgi:hypothetical protein